MRKKEKENIFKSEKFLIAILIFLIALIVFLILKININNNKNIEEKNANIIIPITKSNEEFDFGINVQELVKGKKEYIIKITNYYNDKINEENIYYDITINNSTNCKINLSKNKDDIQTIDMKKNISIKNIKLGSSDKENIYYVIKALEVGKLNSKDLINVKVNSYTKN